MKYFSIACKFLKKKIAVIPFVFGACTYLLSMDRQEHIFYLRNIYYSNIKYSKKEFWEKEYSEDDYGQYDWYLRYDDLTLFFNVYMKKSDKILQIGAGASELSERLYKDGYKNITNIDISQKVIDQMLKKYSLAGMNINYMKMDMNNLQFNEKFDIILDKAGSDIILVSFRPFQKYKNYLKNVHNSLHSGGRYILISLFTDLPVKTLFPFKQWEILEQVCNKKYQILILEKK